MRVRDGLHMGEILNSKSGMKWKGLDYGNVTILGGNLTTTGKFESCPYVCFKATDGDTENTDDENWLRAIPPQVMKFMQPLWLKKIKDKYKDDPDRANDLVTLDAPGGYNMVLTWNESMVSGHKLDIQQLGVGNHGMMPFGRKLRSILENPVTQSKGGAKAAAASDVMLSTALKDKSKLISAISKGSSKTAASSSTDNESEISDMTVVPQAHTVKIGPSATTKTFEADGTLYATFLA